MGYYTYHTLEILNVDTKEAKLKEFLDGGGEHKKNIEELSGYGHSLFEENLKWYDCDDDMREYSKRYPDILFKITGDGEESDDRWEAYYKNGKMQREECKFVFDPYDESKLE